MSNGNGETGEVEALSAAQPLDLSVKEAMDKARSDDQSDRIEGKLDLLLLMFQKIVTMVEASPFAKIAERFAKK